MRSSNRIVTVIIVVVGTLLLLAKPEPVSAQNFGDFGRLLEREAKQYLREAIRPSVPGSLASDAGRSAVDPSRGTPAQPFFDPNATTTQTVPVKTGDGWTLVATRYQSAAPRPGLMPVILCHGLGYNANFWDLEPSSSLARDLAARGFDVWAVSLRGSGLSTKWVFQQPQAATEGLIGDAVRRLSRGRFTPNGYATVDSKYSKWTLDDHINYDVPALVWMVRRTTGAAEVAWVGHSMGGIVALGHLSRYQNPGIGKLVTIGSQMTMPDGQVIIQFVEELMRTRQRELTGLVTTTDAALQTRQSVHNLFFNEQNIGATSYQALATWAKDTPSTGLLKQYLILGSRGELLDASKQFSYARALGNVQVPILIAGGAADQLAPPSVQEYLHRHVGSTDKTLWILGRVQGLSIDAGHNDAVIGLNSRTEVYPALAGWLAR